MWQAMRRWLNTIDIEDPIIRHQAAIFQVVLLAIIATSLLTLPLTFTASANRTGQLVTAAADLLALPFVFLALRLTRRGRLNQAVILFSSGFIVAFAMALVPVGLPGGISYLVIPAAPLSFAGLLGTRRGLLFIAAISVLIVVIIAILTAATPQLVGFAAPLQAPLPNVLGLFVAAIGVMTMLLFRFGTSLREALADALAREQELDRLRQELETAVSERTAILQATIDQLQVSQATIRAIGAPILPVLPGVLVAPLMGVLDRERADVLSAKLLQEVQEQRAHAVIIDITGMLMVDTQIVEAILRMGNAMRLLGSQVFVVGIRAEVAQTIVALDIDLRTIATFQNLQGAIQALIARADTVALA